MEEGRIRGMEGEMVLAAGSRTHLPGLGRPFGGMGGSAGALQWGNGKRGMVECPGMLSSALGKLRQGREGGRRNCFTLHCALQQRRLDLGTSASDADELSGGNPCLHGKTPPGQFRELLPALGNAKWTFPSCYSARGAVTRHRTHVGWCKGVCPTLQCIWLFGS